MFSLVHTANSDRLIAPQDFPGTSESGVEMSSFFKTIPPERVGLNGEYDHNGLAKRVYQTLRKQFSGQHLEKLRITQRGRVVILVGQVPDRQILRQMADIASRVMGATYVEIDGVKLSGTSK